MFRAVYWAAHFWNCPPAIRHQSHRVFGRTAANVEELLAGTALDRRNTHSGFCVRSQGFCKQIMDKSTPLRSNDTMGTYLWSLLVGWGPNARCICTLNIKVCRWLQPNNAMDIRLHLATSPPLIINPSSAQILNVTIKVDFNISGVRMQEPRARSLLLHCRGEILTRHVHDFPQPRFRRPV